MSSSIDFDLEPDAAILDLRIASIHVSGRMLRWHVVIWKHLTVGELLRTMIVRSQVTDAKLKFGNVILVELMHGKLHRTFDESIKVDRFRREDFLVVYEVPEQVGDAKGEGRFLTVACHARFQRDAASSHFFEEGDEVYREISGFPLLLRVREGITERCFYELVLAGFYGVGFGGEFPASAPKGETGGPPTPFNLFVCEQSRTLSTGGTQVNPASYKPAKLLCTDGNRNRKAVLVAAEWLEGQEPSPWALQDVNCAGPLSDLPECYMEAIVGVEIGDLCRQTQQLRADRRELLAEIDDLRKALGRTSARSDDVNPGSPISPSRASLGHDPLQSDREIRRSRHPGSVSSRKAYGQPAYSDDGRSSPGPGVLHVESAAEADRLRLALMR